jgi:aryl-alcohol dehydrogenase-like predicted oxidoreductase
MVSDRRGRIGVPAATLGARGPVVSRMGLGLAALGRPAYITSGREDDLPDRSVAGMRTRTFSMLAAAYAAGVRYVDAARSYGRAEVFLAGWLAERGHADVIVGSKWGYRYTGGWQLDAPVQEVKEHSLAMFTTQLAESRALLGDRITLYQVHSLTVDDGLFTDASLLAALSRLRAESVIIGLSATGPRQADTIRRALPVTVDGQQLFTATEVTWNLLEPSVGPAAAEAAAAGWAVLVKEAVVCLKLEIPGVHGLLTVAAGQDVADQVPGRARGRLRGAVPDRSQHPAQVEFGYRDFDEPPGG